MNKFFKLLAPVLLIFAVLAGFNFSKVSAKAPEDMWCGTFQLVWNELMDKIVKGPVEFIGGNPPIANELNKQNFKKDMLSDKSYYVVLGKKSPALKRKIEWNIWWKFREKSDILDKFDWEKTKDAYFIYAMLVKNFEFPTPFKKLADAPFNGSVEKYKFFGVKSNAPENLKQNITVLFYNSPSDYAVSLKTRNDEDVILYRTDSDNNFTTLYKEVQSKTKKDEKFEDIDSLKVPFIKVDKEFSYDELTNREIKNTDRLYIAKAIQTIKFDMDNKGGKLKSEAAMDIMKMSMPVKPARSFDFDKKFYLFMKESSKSQPYFALKVQNEDYLVK